MTIPGVGRKTGNVVRSVAFRLPGLPVDTHVGRLSRRLGLTVHDDPVKVELELNSYLPAAERGDFSLRMILHGRRVCFAQRPGCAHCVLEDICPSSQLPASPAAALPQRRGHDALLAYLRGQWYDRVYQPGSRHLVCSDSRDPPPGVARATAPPTRGRRRFSAQVRLRPIVSSGHLDGPLEHPLGRAQRRARPRRWPPRDPRVRCRGAARRGRRRVAGSGDGLGGGAQLGGGGADGRGYS